MNRALQAHYTAVASKASSVSSPSSNIEDPDGAGVFLGGAEPGAPGDFPINAPNCGGGVRVELFFAVALDFAAGAANAPPLRTRLLRFRLNEIRYGQ